MKSYGIIFMYFVVIQTNAMEQSPQRIMVEWDAQSAAHNDIRYTTLVLGYLEDSKIDLKDKFVLDVCSGTGNISYVMAHITGPDGLVMGIDASKNMIGWANKTYKTQSNLSFHHCCAEELETSANSLKFNVATLFNSFDLIDDKRLACKKIYGCLRENGDFLINGGSGEEPLDIRVVSEMIEDIPLMGNMLSAYGLGKMLAVSYTTEEEYKNIFADAGFDIISCSKKKSVFIFKTPEEFATLQRPIVMSRVTMQSVPTRIFEYVFNKFIENFLTKLNKNENDHYIYPLEEILIHARKSDKK